MKPDRFHYCAFGLDIDSEWEIAQLQSCSAPVGDRRRRVAVRLGEVEPTLVSAPGLRRGVIRTVFRYEVEKGVRITIDLLPGADRRDVADMIMSRLMAIVIYQRGLLPLHASAISIGGGIVAFCGTSGAGKSTLAAALARNGHTVVSDDMLAVTAVAGQIPRAYPGAGRLKLSRAALRHLRCPERNLPLANSQEGKFLAGPSSMESKESALWHDGQPLAALVRLGHGPLSIERCRPLDAMADWPLYVRSGDLISIADPAIAIWQQWLNVASRVPILGLNCKLEFSELIQTAAQIERFLLGATEVR